MHPGQEVKEAIMRFLREKEQLLTPSGSTAGTGSGGGSAGWSAGGTDGGRGTDGCGAWEPDGRGDGDGACSPALSPPAFCLYSPARVRRSGVLGGIRGMLVQRSGAM